jgi:hypothetical protein
MRKRVTRFPALLMVPAVMVAALAVSLVPQQRAANSPNAGQDKPKKLREIAMERDVEVPGLEENSEYFEYLDLKEMAKNARAIVYGKIIEGSPPNAGGAGWLSLLYCPCSPRSGIRPGRNAPQPEFSRRSDRVSKDF